MKQTFTLGDGEARHAQSPKTFYIPSLEERQTAPVGHYARLIFIKPDGEHAERMWVKVTQANADGSYHGTLANGPVLIEAEYNDPVTFEPRHIIDITAP